MDQLLSTHEHWMQMAIALAEEAGNEGEIPVGAVVINSIGQVLATTQNRKQRDQNPTAHAEILAIQTACHRLGHWRLNECALYVTLEPCPMCTGAIIQARLGLLVYGTPDPKTGTIDSVFDLAASAASNHRLQRLGGVCQEQCREQLQSWFAQHRARKRQQSVVS
ncbi:nucleoside deaminase [Synechocystis sp. FACHB-383]|uniref:nucleoside deaminase n=1 Tax=Synechocystis sp. FACHB-383 TaxID=2692864 RepID=UPI0016858149|nr:nucleoside deaminase [Synechocystis sp. FACHB-383]MBD2652197.1 nucleoside deaminase [Synechocystis sp. FACHB-383]